MLPAAMRMRVKDDFTTTVRRGRRCGQPRLVVHLLVDVPTGATGSDQRERAVGETPEGYPQHLSAVVDGGAPVDGGVRVGFVVSRQVGSSVVRNRVERRLRHACRELVGDLPAGCRMVVRANPPASTASFAELEADLRRAVTRCLTAPRRPTGRS